MDTISDRSSELQNQSELKFAKAPSFFEKSGAIRIFLSLIAFMAIFIVMHFREVKVEIFEIDALAPEYVVAQVDFDFYDDEATLILRQEALIDIGKIYKLSDKEIYGSRVEFENFLVYNQDGHQINVGTSFDNLYLALGVVEEMLRRVKFSDPRTIKKMKESGLSIENYIVYTPPELNDDLFLPMAVWEPVSEKLNKKIPEFQTLVSLILGFFEKKEWQIEEDIPAQDQVRKAVSALVPRKYSHVRAGSRIIDRGEKVTSRHVAELQAMKRALGEKRMLSHPVTIVGSLLISFLLLGVSIAYLKANQPAILGSNRKLALLTAVFIITLCIAKTCEFFLLTSKSNLLEVVHFPLFVPFSAILLACLMNVAVATFTAGFLTILLTLALTFDVQEFMLGNLTASVVAILSTGNLHRRKEIFVVCIKAFLAALVVVISIHLYSKNPWGEGLFSDILTVTIFMFVTAILVVGILPLLEAIFKVMTDVTLMEYMDPNSELLRRLTIEAPGTYQHSVVVANLAEAAALAIGANSLFCRVATLYHDVGKVTTPQYFTENQMGGMNLHELLTPQESAEVIMAHVPEGAFLAKKAGLPEQFIDIIQEHHGTTLVYYFFKKALDKSGGDRTKVNEGDFRYPGPKPRSKESAIIMIADTFEAASRSLDTVDEPALMELATRLIREKILDGQFDNTFLTFEELSIVKKMLVKTLLAFAHTRIKYPKRDFHKGEELLSSEA